WLLLIFFLSGKGAASDNTLSLFGRILVFLFPDWDVPPVTLHVGNLIFRKIGHLTEYGFLAFLWYRAYFRTYLDRNPTAVPESAGDQVFLGLSSLSVRCHLLSVSYAAFDEWHQSLMGSRTGTWEDVFIDGIGAWIVLSILSGKRRFVERRLPAEDSKTCECSVARRGLKPKLDTVGED
ncbi:MAG: VanZ family protein, partial [Armatimonadetes bacterium]|nr:VanZ family protein [Armatimonadota bacterium]